MLNDQQASTERDELEDLVLKTFPQIYPICAEHMPLINRFKNGDFARSLLGFMLYGNGYNLRGRSTRYPDGLFYCDGDNIFGIGLFKKTLACEGWHMMAIAPAGDDYLCAVDQFLNTYHQKAKVHGKDEILGESYVRHLNEDQYRSFINTGYRPIDISPWDPEAPSEDEEKNHKLVGLEDIIGYDQLQDQWHIKTLEGEESRNFRVKARLAYNRFDNFLERNNFEFKIVDYTPEYREIAESLVSRHFSLLKNPVGSTPEDYFNIIRYQPTDGCDQYFAKMGFIVTKESSGIALSENKNAIPAMIFIGEKTCPETVALYATFANRDTSILPVGCDSRGFSAISQYCYLRLFKQLIQEGVRWVNVGGSETYELDRFKRQLGARHVPSFWAVKPLNS